MKALSIDEDIKDFLIHNFQTFCLFIYVYEPAKFHLHRPSHTIETKPSNTADSSATSQVTHKSFYVQEEDITENNRITVIFEKNILEQIK